MNLWQKCEGEKYITSLKETAWRIVETQEITSTRKLVDSLDEQDILEELIESTKPLLSSQFFDLHTLLFTPFRYPPLKYGSRFGNRFEHSLWYGSLKLDTAMAEKAYYQFNFLRGSTADFGIVQIPLSAFSSQIKTAQGIKLAQPPFAKYSQLISAPDSYEVSQVLGASMRQAKIEAFNYLSARDPNKGINIALFTPRAFSRKEPNAESLQSWVCVSSSNVVEFVRSNMVHSERLSFPIETFLIEGRLSFPAN